MLTVDLPEGYPARHERIAIERGSGEFLLPVTIVCEGDKTRLLYRTEGFITLREYGFRGDLYRAFRAVRAYARMVYEAQNMLLRPDRLFRSGDRIFVSAEGCGVRLVYGEADAKRSAAYGVYAEALMPVLAELSAKAGVTGAKAAMTQLAKKIRVSNPDYETAVKLIESVERRWNYMQPVGP